MQVHISTRNVLMLDCVCVRVCAGKGVCDVMCACVQRARMTRRFTATPPAWSHTPVFHRPHRCILSAVAICNLQKYVPPPNVKKMLQCYTRLSLTTVAIRTPTAVVHPQHLQEPLQQRGAQPWHGCAGRYPGLLRLRYRRRRGVLHDDTDSGAAAEPHGTCIPVLRGRG